ncbi:MAG TPA: protein kinase [Candidatus Polarisedimenticolia bacterium]|jgi:Tol biopolymer transport system component|nr:protein kinase [Candidatus Polarisedimenticolia bacterium]
MPLSPGTKLGPYEIAAPLGAGGMGEVYKARDPRLDRTVAVKILPTHLSGDPLLRQRFEREAKAVSSLNHPHICTLHDVGSQDGTDYLVMEFLEGETLEVRLERGPLPLAQVLKYGIQIADALDKAHRQGVVHRDLKPGNIMLTTAGAKLLDFGLAKAGAPIAPGSNLTVAPTRTSPVTQHGMIVGTFQYMSPEQVEGRDVDARSDLFAFGATLYEMVTARRAFPGKSSLSVASAILERDPEPISTLAPMTPPALDRTIRKCLAKDPEDRWQTARDLLLELKWIEEAGSQAGVPAVVSTRRRIAERAWMVGVAALLPATAALGVLYYRSVSVEPQVVRAFIPAPEKGNFRFSGGGNQGPVTISPDGRMLAFSAQGADGIQLLYVRPVDSTTAQPLAGTAGAGMPFWSPDSRSIGFFADGKLKRIEASGGPALTLCEVGVVGRGGTWNREGVIVFAPTPNGPLYKVRDTGGQSTPVTHVDTARGETSHRWPQFLPDGRHFLFFARLGALGTSNENNGIHVGSLDGHPPKFLFGTQTNAAYASGYMLFLRGNTLMAQPFHLERLDLVGEAVPLAEQIQEEPSSAIGVFSASQTGVLAYQTGGEMVGSNLFWRDRAGKQTGALGDPAGYMDLSISRDRRKVAVSMVDPSAGPPDIWIYEVSRGLRSRFTFDPAVDRWPIWSPDSTRVAFSSNRRGQFNLYIKSYAGSGIEESLLEDDRDKILTDWSSDGRYVLYETRGDPKTQSDVWALPLSGDRKPIPVLQTPFRELEAVFSPDGRWIAYTSDESGRGEVYVTSFPGPGRKWQVSTSGGVLPRWSGTGREVFFDGPGERIMAAAVSVRGDTFEVGGTQQLFEIRSQRPGNVFDVTPDGQRFLVNTATQAQNSVPMTLVVNWPAELKKK